MSKLSLLHRLPRQALTVGLAFLACSVCALPASAQSNLERVVNGAYTRSHDYDLVHQKIELSAFDWDSTSFEGRVVTTLVALRPAMDSVILDAGHLLRIRSVTGAGDDGAKLRYTTHGDTLVVFPAKPVGFQDTTSFTITYHGKVANGRGLTFIEPDGRPHRPQQIWSQGEAMNNHLWFPTYDFPNDKESWEMVVTVPERYTVVSNGRLVSDKPGPDGTHTVDWLEAKPSATYLVSLVVAPLVKIKDHWGKVPVDYYVYPSDSAKAWPLFHRTVDMIDTYSRLTGVPFPWAKYAQTTVADFFGGMENVSATTLVDWLPDERAYQDRPWYILILIPHELAHMWFGDDVTTENWANMWLNEGFAEFMPGQYWLEKGGPHLADDYYLYEYMDFMSIDHRRRMPLAANGSNNIYPKGALVLRMLKDYLGPDEFWASIHTYLERHAYGDATSDDLRQAILDATGQNLDRFWREWVYDAGYPEFKVDATYSDTAHTLTLNVEQTQKDTATADSTGLKYTTPLVFHMPVTVRVGTKAGDVTQTFALNARTQSLVMHNVNSTPTFVVFDDGNRILKTLDFDEPTAWLAAQLTRDPDLWNRAWVIDQLSKRKDDKAAVNAIAEAATGADYFRTREKAAQALGEIGDAGLPALRRALSDTSAQVRTAAVSALGNVGGKKAIGLIRRAMDRDSSYSVEAAAVGALAAAHAPDLGDVIRKALATPSYRDAMQQAALGAIAQTSDTAFLPVVDSLVNTSPVALYILGALAHGGSSHALDLLVGHLNDPSLSTRRRAVSVLGQMQPQMVLPALQKAQGSLKYDDTKTMVERLIERLQKRGG
ncbi:MAG: M1 family aminopeptidase [Gemmatimonadota bacterium]|jgi:aminopeptidase N